MINIIKKYGEQLYQLLDDRKNDYSKEIIRIILKQNNIDKNTSKDDNIINDN